MRVKYTLPMSVPDPQTVWLSIGVEDSGKGLTKEELNKLFARFAQANPKCVEMLRDSIVRLLISLATGLTNTVAPVSVCGSLQNSSSFIRASSRSSLLLVKVRCSGLQSRHSDRDP